MYISHKADGDKQIENLTNNLLYKKNTFIFESVEKGRIKEDIQYSARTQTKFGNLISGDVMKAQAKNKTYKRFSKIKH